MSVHIVGIGVTPLGKHLDKSVKQLTALAVDAALADAGIGKDAIGAAWFCNTRQGALEGQHGVRGQAALRAYGFQNIPIFNTDNACASSSSGLFQAYAAVEAGLADVALVVGAEKMNYPDRRDAMFEAFKGSWDRDLADEHMRGLIAMGATMPVPEEFRDGAPERSVFMDIYAAQARFHMERFGTTQRQIAAVAAKNHNHSVLNPIAQYRFPMTVDAVLADKLVVWPLTRGMCAPMSDGAAALVVASGAALKKLDAARAVAIRGIGVSSSSDRAPTTTTATSRESPRRRPMSAPGSDRRTWTSPNSMTRPPSPRYCTPRMSASAPMARAVHWRSPARPRWTGGCRSTCRAGCCRRGIRSARPARSSWSSWSRNARRAGERQVAAPRLALAENGGGFHGIEEAACVVTILERPAA